MGFALWQVLRFLLISSGRSSVGAFFFVLFFKCFFVTILVFIIIVFTLSDDEGWMEQGGRRGDLILLESVAVLCGLPHFPVF